MKIAQAIPVQLDHDRSKVSDYVELTKPRLNFLVLVTTMAGFYLGSHGGFNWVLLVHTLVGTALVAASASALNQYLEREADAKMLRTQSRPLPAGRLEPYEAFWFGVVTALIGCAYLAMTVNLLSAILSWSTWFCYLFWYTPLKSETAWNTAAGAIPGAIPPVIGWVAARGHMSIEALALFGILFLWQFPHFFAIAWLYRDDYARGGFRMLSFFDTSGIRTAWSMTAGSLALLGVSLLPSVFGVTGNIYLWTAILLGTAFLGFSLSCVFFGVQNHARRVFLASVIYLPLLLAAMTLDKI